MVTQRNAVDYTLEVKKAFVMKHLAPMLNTLFANIKNVRYEAVKLSNRFDDEQETVTVELKNGNVKRINVSGESCLQIAKDVLKRF